MITCFGCAGISAGESRSYVMIIRGRNGGRQYLTRNFSCDDQKENHCYNAQSIHFSFYFEGADSLTEQTPVLLKPEFQQAHHCVVLISCFTYSVKESIISDDKVEDLLRSGTT